MQDACETRVVAACMSYGTNRARVFFSKPGACAFTLLETTDAFVAMHADCAAKYEFRLVLVVDSNNLSCSVRYDKRNRLQS